MKTCSCGVEIEDGRKKCRYCTAHYARERYHSNDLARKKQIARAMAFNRFKAGIIVKENCRLCNSESSEMHHPDYDKPTEITWLCPSCHDEFHILERKIFA